MLSILKYFFQVIIVRSKLCQFLRKVVLDFHADLVSTLLSILILRARYEMAIYSVEDKKADRYRETVDEYYAFKNEFPESKYLKEAEKIFNESQKVIKD
mgnify:CR=1 FL=1